MGMNSNLQTKNYYINDGLNVLNELDTNGTIQKTMIAGIAELDAQGNITFVHTDVLGSTILLTNALGAVVSEYEYDPFGLMVGLSEKNDNGTDYLYTGQQFDPESELYYYNARYYNPRLGRFISRDTKLGSNGDILSYNRYIYVKNNPLKYVDPTGSEEKSVNKLSLAGVWDNLKSVASYTAGVIQGVTYTINDNFTYGLSSQTTPPPSLSGSDLGQTIGQSATIALSALEIALGYTIGTGGSLGTGVGLLACPATAGAGCVVAGASAGAAVFGTGLVVHGGSMFAYAVGNGGLGGGDLAKRGRVKIEDGNLKKGWEHIESRHILDNHPDKNKSGGSLFPSNTTRAQLEKLANKVVKSGQLIKSEPTRYSFEKRISINGLKSRVRVVVDGNDSVITMFPMKGGGEL